MSTTVQDIIKNKAKEIAQEVIEIRHHIHSNPELSFQEFETAKFVERYLQSLGLHTHRISETGVWAMIEGAKPGKTVGLRADLDALPIEEQSTKSYVSQNKGVMHACGHDVHTACLLGAAKILTQLKDQLSGNIKLIFQPGEEKLPGGASLLIKEGILSNPPVDFMIGQHVMPLIKTGNVGFRKGLYMASTDEIYITITGKGGHGAMPHMGVDPIAVSAAIITNLQQIVSRKASPIIPTVLSFGKINSEGGATNIIPNKVFIEGTLRTLDESWRSNAKSLIVSMAEQIASSFGAQAEVNIVNGYPYLKNEEKLTQQMEDFAQLFLGQSQVETLDMWMAAEDFAYYSQQVPSCFYRLGTRNEEKGITKPVHTNGFDVDEEALETGTGLMAFLAYQCLNNQN
jgi:amidohydrolase